jgi:hypothetical protein
MVRGLAFAYEYPITLVKSVDRGSIRPAYDAGSLPGSTLESNSDLSSQQSHDQFV